MSVKVVLTHVDQAALVEKLKPVTGQVVEIQAGGLMLGDVQSSPGKGRGQRQPTTNTKVTVIVRDMGPRNYGEFNEPLFCNETVLWAVDENRWALLACRSV